MVILVTIAGVILLDFDCDACQSPARAYLIDVSPIEDHSIGLSMFTVMAGTGGCIGYILGGIPWADFGGEKIPFRQINNHSQNFTASKTYYHLAYEHKQILFTSVAVIYVVCTAISITSFKEIPLDILNRKKKKGACLEMQSSKLKYERMTESFDDEFEDNEIKKVDDFDAMSFDKVDLMCEKENSRKLDTLKYYLKSIVKMPHSLRWLCITHCLCWMSLLCYSLYFTDFVGEEIFGKIQ